VVGRRKVTVLLEEDMYRAIERYRAKKGVLKLSEAIRMLLAEAIEKEEIVVEEAKG